MRCSGAKCCLDVVKDLQKMHMTGSSAVDAKLLITNSGALLPEAVLA